MCGHQGPGNRFLKQRRDLANRATIVLGKLNLLLGMLDCLLPLPISLPEIYRAKTGGFPTSFLDDRLQRYTDEMDVANEAREPFSPAERAELDRRLRDYWPALGRALLLDSLARDVPAPREEWRKRQASIADLELQPKDW